MTQVTQQAFGLLLPTNSGFKIPMGGPYNATLSRRRRGNQLELRNSTVRGQRQATATVTKPQRAPVV